MHALYQEDGQGQQPPFPLCNLSNHFYHPVCLHKHDWCLVGSLDPSLQEVVHFHKQMSWVLM